MKRGGPRAGRREQVALAVVAGVALLVAGRLALRRPSGEIPLLLVSPTPQAFPAHAAGAVWPAAGRGAGGPTFRADLNAVNWAQPLGDGDRVFIPRQPEPVLSSGAEENEAPAGSGRRPALPRAALDVNTATAADLEHLPGIGPVLAG